MKIIYLLCALVVIFFLYPSPAESNGWLTLARQGPKASGSLPSFSVNARARSASSLAKYAKQQRRFYSTNARPLFSSFRLFPLLAKPKWNIPVIQYRGYSTIINNFGGTGGSGGSGSNGGKPPTPTKVTVDHTPAKTHWDQLPLTKKGKQRADNDIRQAIMNDPSAVGPDGYLAMKRNGWPGQVKFVQIDGKEELWVKLRPDPDTKEPPRFYATSSKTGKRYTNEKTLRSDHRDEAFEHYGLDKDPDIVLHHESEIHWDPKKKDWFVYGTLVPKDKHTSYYKHFGGNDKLITFNQWLANPRDPKWAHEPEQVAQFKKYYAQKTN